MYVNIIEHSGSIDEWVLLWQACQTDAETRESTINLLSTIDPLQADVIRMWADMLGVPWPESVQSAPAELVPPGSVKWCGKDLSAHGGVMRYRGRMHIDPIRGAIHLADLERNPTLDEVLHADDYEVEIRVLRSL